MHGVYDLGAGGFSHLELTDKHGGEALDRGAGVEGEIRIADRGNSAGEDLRLAVEWHVLAELRDRHLRQPRLGRDAAFDQMRGRRRLSDARAALRTGVAGAYGLDDAILRGRHVETAGAVLADLNHQAAAAGACEARGFDHAFDARQMGGKGASGAARSLPRDRASRAARAILLAFLRFGDRECPKFCVRGRVDHHAMTNLSSNMMANWVLAWHHSRGAASSNPTPADRSSRDPSQRDRADSASKPISAIRRVQSIYERHSEWDIELAFKRLKTLLRIDCLPAKTDKGGRSWIYAHLILAIATDACSQDFLNSSP